MLSFLLNLGNKITEEKFKGINVYHILHYVWLIVTYYLVLNSLYEFVIHFLEIKELAQLIPAAITNYNSITMSFFQQWIPFTFILGVGLFVSAIFVSMAKGIFFTKNSGIILNHADAGLFFSKWLMIIASTYYVYSWTGEFFPLLLFSLLLLTFSLEKLRGFLETKYGITFGNGY
ncbi:hypothetical protein [Brevibacillus choshinensis]|uniref:hypothetical protein n=1 Tax=Brevibacillus choshinensis TaxID=54911 RepID=UPI002E215002|nr:hypothetical protein [Brevibacillus choshinensis]